MGVLRTVTDYPSGDGMSEQDLITIVAAILRPHVADSVAIPDRYAVTWAMSIRNIVAEAYRNNEPEGVSYLACAMPKARDG